MENEKDEPNINLKKRRTYWEWWTRWISQESGENEEREAPGITGHGQDMMWNPRGGELKRRVSPFLRGASRIRCGRMKYMKIKWRSWTRNPIFWSLDFSWLFERTELLNILFVESMLNVRKILFSSSFLTLVSTMSDAEVTQRLRAEMSAETVKTRKHLAPH